MRCCRRKVLALVPLPIAGLMNDLPVEQMAKLVNDLSIAWKEMGCVINSPYMTMALIPLACLPELRLTNRDLWTAEPSALRSYLFRSKENGESETHPAKD